MDEKVIKAAYGGLLHDIGKALQRRHARSDLSEQELYVTPVNSKGGFHSHLHSGYTSRFFKDELGLFDQFEYEVSAHHLPWKEGLNSQIIKADYAASSIDRSDEDSDTDQKNRTGRFQQVRLSSIMELVDFGKPVEKAKLPLSSLMDFQGPIPEGDFRNPDLKTAVSEYEELCRGFLKSVREEPDLQKIISSKAFNLMYARLYEWMTTVPASTYEGTKTYVSLFDHLKLTSAIAACMAASDSKKVKMLEFDISGIQKFIFRVTEGDEAKKKVTKSLRGRSFLISLITDVVTMSFLHEFGMPVSNIIFNTGGGALLLLPDSDDFEERAGHVSHSLQEALFEMFNADLTFVYAWVDCDLETKGHEETALQNFKTSQAVLLKSRLELAKTRKYERLLSDDPDFFFSPAQNQSLCPLCGGISSGDGECFICQKILEISDFLVKNKDICILFSFDKSGPRSLKKAVSLSIGNCTVHLTTDSCAKDQLDQIEYVESVNHTFAGITKYLADEVPMARDVTGSPVVLNMEEICSLADNETKKWGDPKLGILKMDVDNLGAIFAYGLDSNTRSLSKFLTLSRMIEVFFGKNLNSICKEVSEFINPEIGTQTVNGTMFYITYAGGDDLVVIGPAAGIIKLAETIRNRFAQYTRNENITISAGIAIQRPTQPIRYGVLEAERQLDLSKEAPNKNSVSMIDTTISFPTFSDMLEKVEFWKTEITKNSYSRTGFYTITTSLQSCNQNEFSRKLPIILYALHRNSRSIQFEQEFKKRVCALEGPIRKSNQEKFEKDMKKLILEMKLTLMQTRG